MSRQDSPYSALENNEPINHNRMSFKGGNFLSILKQAKE